MTNQDILFASLVGSKVLKVVPALQQVNNEMMKHVLPPIPFLPIKNIENVKEIQNTISYDVWKADAPKTEESQFFPLKFSIDGQNWFLLPFEPLININGKNILVRRNVAKWNAEFSKNLKGSIKERWSQDDYEITITGALYGAELLGKPEDCFPVRDFEKLKEFMTHSKEVYVSCFPLEKLGINKIAIEDFSWPFTKGENVQAYSIKAYSDDSYNLLLEV